MSSERSGELNLVTGATGLLGSHIAERLVARGDRVRALVRSTSQTAYLDALGVELCQGDLTNPEDCERAVRGVSVVHHAAAKVGDWGPWPEFQRGVIDATANIARAAAAEGVRRFVHISSTSAYGHPAEGGPPVDETAQLGQNFWRYWDYYTRSKVDAERVLWGLAESNGLHLTIIRPSWLYGERDRTTVARLVSMLRRRRAVLVGRGDNPLSAIYAGEVAGAAILAADHPSALGEAFNITDQGPITQRQYLDMFADAIGARRVKRRLPFWFVWSAATVLEARGRWLHRARPPLISRYATWLMGRQLSYSTEKARELLGWKPELSYEQSIARAVRWYLDDEARKAGTAQKPTSQELEHPSPSRST